MKPYYTFKCENSFLYAVKYVIFIRKTKSHVCVCVYKDTYYTFGFVMWSVLEIHKRKEK